MSVNEDINSQSGFDTADQQPTYIYNATEDTSPRPTRPAKRRKTSAKNQANHPNKTGTTASSFVPLLSGLEPSSCVALRKELYERSWAITAERIQGILNDANEDVLSDVNSFVTEERLRDDDHRLPTAFIVTGPNIASQELLFTQLSARLKANIDGQAVLLRSSDSTNLKAVLKQVIRDATNQRHGPEEEEEVSNLADGRKLLNYDLEILHGFVEAHGSSTVVVAFQDSEAFDSLLLAELITLFNSWLDRIPFVLLFGVATSVDLFHERLPRSASRCLVGAQFDVERTSLLLERVFSQAVAGAKAPVRLSPALISTLIERQEDHLQSVQSFVASLKYSYMCHYYFDALSIFNPVPEVTQTPLKLVQDEHFKAIRKLRSFRNLIEKSIRPGMSREEGDWVLGLIGDDNGVLLNECKRSLAAKDAAICRYLRAIHLVTECYSEHLSRINVYLSTFAGNLGESEYAKNLLDAIKRMTAEELIGFTEKICKVITDGEPELDLPGWAGDEQEFSSEILEIHSQISALSDKSTKAGKPLRSCYTIHNKGIRTTVIAQRVQLSYESSVLSNEDKAFTALVDRLSIAIQNFLTLGPADDTFLNEVWTTDHLRTHREVFLPRPRAAIEHALTDPSDYLACECCESGEGSSGTHPATAILYQLYLETSSLINMYDLWSAFFEMIGGGDDEKVDERDALVIFYKALADLKSMGMVKQSKKKVDHLAKVAWSGL